MIYQNKYFILDTSLRKVFDENNKELKITGNSFRVLVFLCEHGPSTITDISDALDRAKDYDEDHIRQYRYKINTIIGKNIIKYENKIYLIDGITQRIGNKDALILDKNNRNTDLLQPKPYNKAINMKNYKKIFISLGILLISVIAVFYIYQGFNFGCNIKGNINANGEKIYHTVDCPLYKETNIDKAAGEKWFCGEKEATVAGWRKALNCNK
ncbi:MAG: hypothetical protein Q7R92_01010 [bacterium]|nr:hypothetical protein [bacterium]